MSQEPFDSRIESVRDQHRRKPEHAAKPADPYDLREHTRDVLEGAHEKRPEIWRQVMERHGFRWYEPAELTRRIGPQTIIPSQQVSLVDPLARAEYVRPHRDGQWRNDLHARVPEGLRTAFTVVDLFGLFGTPERFDEWFQDRERRYYAARRGLQMPKEKSVVMGRISVPVGEPGKLVLAKR